MTISKLTNKICNHRSVAHDGRIVCNKITQGNNEVSPNLCRDCPAKQVSCDKLCFSLEKSSPSPILIRYGNGHSEVWNDEPASITFLKAACSAKIAPISDPRQCAACALRTIGEPARQELPLPNIAAGGPVPFVPGPRTGPYGPVPEDQGYRTKSKVIPFPQRLAATS